MLTLPTGYRIARRQLRRQRQHDLSPSDRSAEQELCGAMWPSMMKEWLNLATEFCVTIINILALIIIVAGTLEAFVGALWAMLMRRSGHERRDIWLRQARWLVAGLTVQLAADIIETAITTSWEAVGRLAAIAAIRTFLNYFLERDLTEIRKRQAGQG